MDECPSSLGLVFQSHIVCFIYSNWLTDKLFKQDKLKTWDMGLSCWVIHGQIWPVCSLAAYKYDNGNHKILTWNYFALFIKAYWAVAPWSHQTQNEIIVRYFLGKTYHLLKCIFRCVLSKEFQNFLKVVSY